MQHLLSNSTLVTLDRDVLLSILVDAKTHTGSTHAELEARLAHLDRRLAEVEAELDTRKAWLKEVN